MLENCIFCKIIKGDIPNYTVYEDDNTLAFLDINPHAKGHTVLIPKKHAERVQELHMDQLSELMIAVQKVVAVLDRILTPEGYNIGWNNGVIAGQVVPHLHIHIIPRWEGDGGGSMHSIINNHGSMSVEEVFRFFTKS